MTDIIIVVLAVTNIIGAFLFIRDFCEDELLSGIRVKHVFYLTIFLPATILFSLAIGMVLLILYIIDKFSGVWDKKLF